MTDEFVVINEKFPHWCLGKIFAKVRNFDLQKTLC
jgi:hypothetical protein